MMNTKSKKYYENGAKLKEYVRLIMDLKLLGITTQPEMIIELLRNMGYTYTRGLKEDTIKKWFSGERVPNLSKVNFVDSKGDPEIDVIKFNKFLKERMGSIWKRVRDAFKLLSERFDTDDKDTFYNELLAYLLEILHLPVPDEVEEKRIKIVDTPENTAEPEKDGIPVHRRSMPDSTEATKEKTQNEAIPVDNADSGVQATTGLIVDPKYKKCISCNQWGGQIDDAMQMPSGVYGRCRKYNKEQISTGGENCTDYEPNLEVATKLMLACELLSIGKRTGIKFF